MIGRSKAKQPARESIAQHRPEQQPSIQERIPPMTEFEITLTTQEIEGMFLQWLQGHGVPLKLSQFQMVLAESDSKLSEELCLMNDFPVGSTVGHAARSLIAFCNQNGVEYRLDTKINFKSEAASLRWWRQNRDNPNRVRLERQGDGSYSLSIAGISGPVKEGWKDGF